MCFSSIKIYWSQALQYILHHVGFKTNLQISSRACYGRPIFGLMQICTPWLTLLFLYISIHTYLQIEFTHCIVRLLIMHFWHSLDILSIVFAQRFRRSIMVTWLKRFEHCQNLSCAIQVCQLWFNIVKRDLTEESLGQRAWSQLWQGTPISEHCGP